MVIDGNQWLSIPNSCRVIMRLKFKYSCTCITNSVELEICIKLLVLLVAE